MMITFFAMSSVSSSLKVLATPSFMTITKEGVLKQQVFIDIGILLQNSGY